ALPGAAVETPLGPAWVRTVRYPLAERPDLAGLLEVGAEALAAAGRDPRLARVDPTRLAFMDTETTGLAQDTSTYTFLIGIGLYEGASGDAGRRPADAAFVVRQFFMRTPAEEPGQLYLVEDLLDGVEGLITFNGRGFDLPLLQTRFTLARRPFRWLDLPHLDLLPAARRIWRGAVESCRLVSLEQSVLGIRRTEEDVPGYLIPDIYRQYYLTGTVSEWLVRVFYHNLMDIVSMPLLAARLAHLYRTDDLADKLAALNGAERLNLARAYVELGWHTPGETAYRAALAVGCATAHRDQAYRELGFLLKRAGRRAEAAGLWEEWISTSPGNDLTPYIELAKYHEWHTADLVAARGWAAWALHIAESRPDHAAESAELRHRLARLEQKLSNTGHQDGGSEIT
ncbi:MAG: ribonuclease H-like domain-containing protein, partial [Anaerolineae bacterium]|nr:ribonuclease H-like domain-containing protein [Anaerolineae bacterium]